jgi:(1->4)-alpha-D-glucan 1-alpha-D-glucosylmutase
MPESDLQDYAARLKAYMTKACREAKLNTSWTEPDDAYEGAVHQLIDLILQDPELSARIGGDIRPFAWYGALNSLSLTALKLTVPGVPDIYQGANVLDDSLVDPDNRRPVDFVAREQTIRELVDLEARPADEIRRSLAQWLAAGDFGRLKLWTIHRLLGWRALHPQLFELGDYRPVPVRGPHARHCVAYVRSNPRHGVLVLATRLYRELGYPDADAAAQSTAVSWGDTCVDLHAAGIRAVNLRDILLDAAAAAGSGADGADDPAAAPPLQALLGTLPIAAISFDIAQP